MTDSSQPAPPPQSYIICAGPRTGSNLLAAAMRRSGVAGWPLEFFNAGSANGPFMLNALGLETADPGPVDFAARLPQIFRKGTAGGMFGTTLHWADAERLRRAISSTFQTPPDATFAETLRAALPGLRFIWLRREDKLAQAISHHTAKVTGVWQKKAAADADESGPEIPFDFDIIEDLVNFAMAEDAGWRALLAGQEADTLPITYESFAADYAGTVTSVLAFLGREPPPRGLGAPPFQRQANERSAELAELYQAEAARRALQNSTDPA